MIAREEIAQDEIAAAAPLAEAFVAGAEAPIGGDRDALVIAWALKERCYAAWSSEPQTSVRAADALQRLADAYAAPSNHDERIRTEIRALAEWTSGIAQITRGAMAHAAQCFDAAAAHFRELDQGIHAAQTQVPKIMVLSMLGQYDAAVACAEAAREAFVALGDVRSAGKVSLNLSAMHERRGDYVEAARQSRAATVQFARVGDREHSVMADINTANALSSLGDFDEALRIYARARMRAQTHEFPVLEALAEESIALVLLTRGEYRDALAGLERSRRQYEQLGMPHQIATAEKQLGDAYLELGLLPEALALFEKAHDRFAQLQFPDEQAWALTQIGRVQALLGARVEATTALQAAATLFVEQALPVGTATVALARAELALADGDAIAAGEFALAAGTDFLASGFTASHLRAELVRAHALLSASDNNAARALFASTLERARSSQLITLQVRCLTGEGAAALARDDNPGATQAFESAIALFEEQRHALPDDGLRTAFANEHLRPYEGLLRIALANPRRLAPAQQAIEVMLQLDRVRARSLGERVDADSDAKARSESSRETQDLRARLNWLYRRARREEEAGSPSETLRTELQTVEQALLEGARRERIGAGGRSAGPARANDRTLARTNELDLAALQSLLQPHDALVEYGVLDDEIFACVVTRDAVHLQRHLAPWPQVVDALRGARFQMETLRHGATPLREHLSRLTARANARLTQLHGFVWAPLAHMLDDKTRVLIVPCGELGWLPFSALHDGGGTLAAQCQMAVVPSARLAVRGLAQAMRPCERVVALGESSRLAHAEAEARRIAALFPAGTAYVGEEATLATLHAEAAGADVLHLACHAEFRSDNPQFSALHLHDGMLTAELAESLRLRPGIVVLSACETGLAERARGDETIGLVRAFLIAGAARVVASSWPVEDAVAAGFMNDFYTALRGGVSPSAALQAAQLTLMSTHPHPFYWAAFSLYGGM